MWMWNFNAKLIIMYVEKISSRFSNNSEAFASELLWIVKKLCLVADNYTYIYNQMYKYVKQTNIIHHIALKKTKGKTIKNFTLKNMICQLISK